MKRMIASVLAAFAVGVAGSAYAAATPTTQGATEDQKTCQALIMQFDQAVGAHNQAPKVVEGRAKRSSGETSCKSGNYRSGISDLRAALNDIGVKPVQLPAS
jgi:hypothetical protein